MGIPSPADPELISARELVEHIRNAGGRIYRYRAPTYTFVLTDDVELTRWLVQRGGKPFVPVGMGLGHDGSYLRAKGGKKEWDIVISGVPVKDVPVGDLDSDALKRWRSHAIWKAAA